MMWLILAVLGLALAAKPLVRLYRAAVPNLVGPWDAATQPTAFDDDLRGWLGRAGFRDTGAHLIGIGDMQAVMHLWQRSDGTVVTGMSLIDGTVPAYYLTTVLGEGRGWLESRTTDRTPGPRQELVQVVPDAGPGELLLEHDRALATITGLGVSTVRMIEPVEVHLLQGNVTRRSLRQNPLPWIVGLIGKALAPDRPKVIEHGSELDRRVRALRMA